MIYFIWAVFVNMAPFKIVTLDDMWDQMNRTVMYILCVTIACFIDFGLIAGSPIKCIGFHESFTREFAEDYCWTQGIYTIREAYDVENTEIPYPGIIPEEVPPCLPGTRWDGVVVLCPEQGSPYIKPPTRVYHLWYQFVQFYFWAVSALFYLPYMIYSGMDIAYVKPLIKMLHNPVVTPYEMSYLIDKGARWMRMRFDVYTEHRGSRGIFHRRNALLYTVLGTKLLYLFYTISLMYATDSMFKVGSFVTYGIDWVGTRPSNDSIFTLPQDKLFPKIAACEIKRWGPTGMDYTRGMCVLTQNVSNSYLFLIFWFFLVLTIAGNVLGLSLTIFRTVYVRAGYHNLVSWILHDDPYTEKLYQRVGCSGRIVLLQLAQNVHPNTFERLVRRYRWLKRYEHVEYNGHLKVS